VAITAAALPRVAQEIGNLAAAKTQPIDDANRYQELKDRQAQGTATPAELAWLSQMELAGYSPAKAEQVLADPKNQEDYANWKEGGPYRVAAHAALGALGSGLSGALGSGTAAMAAPAIADQINQLGLPQEAKDILLLAGSTLAGSLAGGSNAALAAGNTTANNFLKHQDLLDLNKLVQACQRKPQGCSADEYMAFLALFDATSRSNIAEVQRCLLAQNAACVSNVLSQAAPVGDVQDSALPSEYLDMLYDRQRSAQNFASLADKSLRLTDGKYWWLDDVGVSPTPALDKYVPIDPTGGQTHAQVVAKVYAALQDYTTAIKNIDERLSAEEQAAARKLQLERMQLVVSLMPVAGTLTSLYELVTGKTYYTQEEANRYLAAIGVVAGLSPAGKLILREASAAEVAAARLANDEAAVARRTLAEANAAQSDAKLAQAETKAADDLAGACLAPPACFVAGTLIHTAQGLKAIEAFQGGELVLSRHEHSHEIGYRPVVSTKVTHDQALFEVVVSNPSGITETLHTTSEHPFWVTNLEAQAGWMKASALRAGMQLIDPQGRQLSVQTHAALAQAATVYNIEVAEHHTYFVGKLGVWVHNASCCEVRAENAVAVAERGSINKTKLGSQSFVMDTAPGSQAAIKDVMLNGDQLGTKTERIVNDALAADKNVTVLSGTNYAGNKGLDHVVQFTDPDTGKLMTLIIDSKQLAKNGTTGLNPEAAGGLMQLSDGSLTAMLPKLGSTPASNAIDQAMLAGTLLKAVAFIDRTTGELKIIPVKP
jgi:filamentous hemagglutinin